MLTLIVKFNFNSWNVVPFFLHQIYSYNSDFNPKISTLFLNCKYYTNITSWSSLWIWNSIFYSVVCSFIYLFLTCERAQLSLSGASLSSHPSLWSCGSDVTSRSRFQSHQALPPGSPKCSFQKMNLSEAADASSFQLNAWHYTAEHTHRHTHMHKHTTRPVKNAAFSVDQRQADCFRLWGATNWSGITTNKCDNVFLRRSNGPADCSVHSNQSLKDKRWEICQR